METEQSIVERAGTERVALMLAIGEPSGEFGRATVRVVGAGRVEVRQETAAEETPEAQTIDTRARLRVREYSGDLGRDGAAALIARAERFPWWQRFPPRPGIPDEAIVEWGLQEPDGRTRTLKAWLRDVERDREQGPVLGELRAQVSRLTDGEVVL